MAIDLKDHNERQLAFDGFYSIATVNRDPSQASSRLNPARIAQPQTTKHLMGRHAERLHGESRGLPEAPQIVAQQFVVSVVWLSGARQPESAITRCLGSWRYTAGNDLISIEEQN